MSDFITRLELDLLDAADRLHPGQDAVRPAGRNGHRRGKARLMVVGLAALVLAAPALAGVPGVWRGVLDGPERQPTLTSEQPGPQLLAELATLRRPATAIDRSAQARAAVAQSGPLDGVSVDGVRYVGVSPIGDPLFLVPYHSRIRLLPRETDTGGPPPLRRSFNQPGGPQASRLALAHRAADEGNLQRFLNRPGVCLIGVATGTPEIFDCVASAEIEAGTDYATVGVYRTHPEAETSSPTTPNPPHVIATLASGIVPDDVASVELTFSSGKEVTLTVRNNYFAFLVGPEEESVPAITWIGPDGRVLREIRSADSAHRVSLPQRRSALLPGARPREEVRSRTCSVAAGQCVIGCALPVVNGHTRARSPLAGCSATASRPCTEDVSSTVRVQSDHTPAPFCRPQTSELRVEHNPPPRRRR